MTLENKASDCTEDALEAYLSDALPDAETSWIEQHLAQCKSCRDLTGQLSSSILAIEEWTAQSHREAYLQTCSITEGIAAFAKWFKDLESAIAEGLRKMKAERLENIRNRVILPLARTVQEAIRLRALQTQGAYAPKRDMLIDVHDRSDQGVEVSLRESEGFKPSCYELVLSLETENLDFKGSLWRAELLGEGAQPMVRFVPLWTYYDGKRLAGQIRLGEVEEIFRGRKGIPYLAAVPVKARELIESDRENLEQSIRAVLNDRDALGAWREFLTENQKLPLMHQLLDLPDRLDNESRS